MRSLPWVRAIHSRYGERGVSVIGIHTPEFEHERDRSAVEAFVRENDVGWPQLLDPDYEYWNAVSNHYWPTVYLIDKRGQVRSRFVGEVHEGDPRAQQIESEIDRLLAER